MLIRRGLNLIFGAICCASCNLLAGASSATEDRQKDIRRERQLQRRLKIPDNSRAFNTGLLSGAGGGGGGDRSQRKPKDAEVAEDAVKEQFIVKFDDKVDDVERETRQIMETIKDSNIELLYTYKHVFKGAAFAGVKGSTKDFMAKMSSVVFLEPNYQIRTSELQQTPGPLLKCDKQPASYGLNRIDQRDARSFWRDDEFLTEGHYCYTHEGEGVNVYILDTGVRETHSEFMLPDGTSRASCGYNAISYEDCQDYDYHGTHVAGTAAGKTYGVAKKATIISVKVLDGGGSGSTAGVIAGMDWVKGQKEANPTQPMVVNMSLGGFFGQSQYDAGVALTESGVVLVAAGGNGSDDSCFYTPAAIEPAITVGATDDRDRETWFTSAGSCVDIYAPGDRILSSTAESDTATDWFSGTSMSAPHVAGAVALLLEEYPTNTVAQITNKLKARATKDAIRMYDDSLGAASPNLLLNTRPCGISLWLWNADTDKPIKPLYTNSGLDLCKLPGDTVPGLSLEAIAPCAKSVMMELYAQTADGYVRIVEHSEGHTPFTLGEDIDKKGDVLAVDALSTPGSYQISITPNAGDSVVKNFDVGYMTC